jgi:uncharacterized protein YcfJ
MMDKSMIKGIVVGAAVITAVGGVAGYQVSHRQPAYAEVIKAEPVVRTVKLPRQVCKDEVVTRKAPVRDRDRIAGTAIGAVVGGLLGNQIGAGGGRTVATVGGAAAGGYAGNQIQKNMQDSDTQSRRQTHCKTEYDSQEEIMAYDVTYRLGGQQSVVRMDYDPGDRIPVKGGKLVLTRPDTQSNSSS